MNELAPIRLIYCPCCTRPTDSLRSVDVPLVFFGVIYIVWNSERVVGCPNCLRTHVARRTALSLPLANIVFPLLLPFLAVEWATTFRPGHGLPDEELRRYESPPPPRAAFQSKPTAGRLIAVLAILVVVALAIFLFARLSGAE